MKRFVTQFRAVDRTDGEVKTWEGPLVYELTFKRAEDWCKKNRPYLQVLGELVRDIPCKPGTWEPDWDNAGPDFNKIQNN